MKKITFILTTLLTVVFILSSCDDSNAKREDFDISQGIWEYTERHVELSDAELTSHVNWYFGEDSDTVRVVQTFDSRSKISTLTAYSLATNAEKRSRQYEYSIVGDSLYLLNPAILTDTLLRGVFRATTINNKPKLEMKFNVRKQELRTILLDINWDPSRLGEFPADLSGTYYITAKQ